jgi:hypothetical protein
VSCALFFLPNAESIVFGMARLIASTDRNTTLPHPDADTSENATIEAPDISLSRTNSRHSFRLGFHHSRRKESSSTIEALTEEDSSADGDNISQLEKEEEEYYRKASIFGKIRFGREHKG